MNKPVKLFALLFMVVFCITCKEQGKTNLPKDTTLQPETKDVICKLPLEQNCLKVE